MGTKFTLASCPVRFDRPNQVWCADITCLPMRRGFLYLVAIVDSQTCKVLARRRSNTLEADLYVDSLNEANHKLGPPGIMNIDQVSQFTSLTWTDRLRRSNVCITIDRKGRFLDNIFVEWLWRSLKYDASTCRPWKLDQRRSQASECESTSTIIGAHIPPLAANRVGELAQAAPLKVALHDRRMDRVARKYARNYFSNKQSRARPNRERCGYPMEFASLG